MDYLKTPLIFQNAASRRLSTCSYEESIAQNIMLLILSHNGEVAGKEDYGSIIWELEFNQLVKQSDWEEEVKNSIARTIEKHEKRLRDVEVNVQLSEIAEEQANKFSHIRRKAQITVAGKIEKTDADFHFSTLVYISPLAQ